MKVMWLVNIMLPAYAQKKKLAASAREGWLSGMYEAFLKKREEDPEAFELAVCFPMKKPRRKEVIDGVTFYPFKEDLDHPERYVRKTEKVFAQIIADYEPDIVHIFGAEFPHTLAFVRAFQMPERTLICLQGICTEIARYYRADLPDNVFSRATLRDAVTRDSLESQQEKMKVRGVRERGALLLAGHIAGRTAFDREFVHGLCPRAYYHTLHETMRAPFYEGRWRLTDENRHEIFVAQGDYPLKGLHFVIRALPSLLKMYPDLHLTVAGYQIFDHPGQDKRPVQAQARFQRLRRAKQVLPQDLRNGAYGEYLRQLIAHYGLFDHITTTGMLDAGEMRDLCLSSHVLICPSMLENSSNAVCEAMLLGLPVIASRTGGMPSLVEDNVNGLLFTTGDARDLAGKIRELFEDDALCERLSDNAVCTAKERHDPQKNVEDVFAVYEKMTQT